MTTRTLAFVFARGGSKGIPGKNLQDLGGKPLIAHSILCGLETPGVERVIVSTDSEEIADVARTYGAEVPFLRPEALASDSSAEYLSWKHAVQEMTTRTGSFEFFLSLPATSPLRSVNDVRNCLEMISAHPDTDMVLTVQKTSKNPYFNMVRRDNAGFCHLASDAGEIIRRQDAPEVFDITTVAYGARTEYVMRTDSLLGGRLRCVEVPKERAVDIDEMLDLEWARYLYARRFEPDKK